MKPYVKAELHAGSLRFSGYSTDTNGNGNGTDELQSGGEEKDSSVYKRRSATGRTDCPNFKGETMTWLKMADVIQELSFLLYAYFSFFLTAEPPWALFQIRFCPSGSSLRLVRWVVSPTCQATGFCALFRYLSFASFCPVGQCFACTSSRLLFPTRGRLGSYMRKSSHGSTM